MFLADAEPTASPDYSPPGQPYTNGTAGFWRVLHDQRPLVFGPYCDQWGRWITACAPIRRSSTGQVIALLGLDTDIQSWIDNATAARRPRFFLTMLMSLLPLTGFLFIHRHRATNQLLDAEINRFQTVFNLVNDAITIHDFNTGDILQANRRAYEMVGCKPGEPASLNLLPFRAQPEAPFDAAAAIRHLSQAAAGQPQLFEWRTRHRDGHPLWIEVSLQQVAFGARPRIMAVVRDINARKQAEAALLQSHDELELRVRERTAELARANTSLQEDIAARRHAEAALRESEGRFRALAEADSSAIMIHQGDRVIYANPGAEKVFGYTREELSKMNWWVPIHPEHRNRVRQRGLDRLAEKKSASQDPIKIITRAGEERWVYASMGPITVNGQAAVVVTLLDITELRRLETEREQISQRLAQLRRLESLGAMAGGIAHDFNNLLMTVLGNADLLLAKLPPGSPTYQQVEDIHTAGRRAADISSRMLIYAGGELFNGQPLDLAFSLRELRSTLVALVGPSTEFRLETPAACSLILGDPS
ncbi:MAG: PAS domain S-box protein, partial [bacterium]